MATGFVNSLGVSFPLTGTYGGTGVNNGAHTLTVNANSVINQDVSTAGSPTFVLAYAANFVAGYATTATAAATTTLLVGSAYQQYFTGTTTQTVALPVTSTLVLGQAFLIVNNSTGVVTVQSSGANTVQAMAAGSQLVVTCILTSGTSAASWNVDYTVLSGGVQTVSGTSNRITSTGGANPVIDISASYVGQSSITTVGALSSGSLATGFTAVTVPLGGTGLSTFTTAYAPVISGTTATGNLQVASTGLSTAGFVLTSNGASAVPSFQAAPTSLAWVSVAGTTQTAAANTAYGLQNAGQVTVTLPASAGLTAGQLIKVEGYGAGGFIIQAVGSQVINAYNGRNTSAAGTVTTSDALNTTSSASGCMAQLRYTGTDTFWLVEFDGNFVFA